MNKELRNYCVYLLSFSNGKFYVGITKNFQQRLDAHYRNYKIIIEFKILRNNLTIIQAGIWERIEIANYQSYLYQKNPRGYNKTLGGNHCKYEHKFEIKIKKRKALSSIRKKASFNTYKIKKKKSRVSKKKKHKVKFSELHEFFLNKYKNKLL